MAYNMESEKDEGSPMFPRLYLRRRTLLRSCSIMVRTFMGVTSVSPTPGVSLAAIEA